MKHAHSLKLSVFSYEYENSRNILDGFLRFFPFSLEENKIGIKNATAAGFNESKIGILEVTLTKASLISRFIQNILEKLDEWQKNLILEQIGSRLDCNLDFFLRFDKSSWIDDKKLVLTDTGKCFHIKMSVAAFPRKREAALKIIRELFGKRQKIP